MNVSNGYGRTDDADRQLRKHGAREPDGAVDIAGGGRNCGMGSLVLRRRKTGHLRTWQPASSDRGLFRRADTLTDTLDNGSAARAYDDPQLGPCRELTAAG